MRQICCRSPSSPVVQIYIYIYVYAHFRRYNGSHGTWVMTTLNVPQFFDVSCVFGVLDLLSPHTLFSKLQLQWLWIAALGRLQLIVQKYVYVFKHVYIIRFCEKKNLRWSRCADLCGAAFPTPRTMDATSFSTCTSRPELVVVFVQLAASIEMQVAVPDYQTTR
jgi:hypothetical protein